MLDEGKILEGCKKGDIKAQRELYTFYSSRMMALCYRYVRNTYDAEEILQEGFIKMFHHIHQFQNKGSFEGWFKKIMVNTAINYLRKQKRLATQLADEATEFSIQDTPLAEVNLNVKELMQLISNLPLGYRTIFNLHAIEGYDYIEIAEMLELSQGTCRSQYFRAKAMLAVWIKGNAELIPIR